MDTRIVSLPGIDVVFADETTSHITGFSAKATENFAQRSAQVSTAPSGSRGYPTQNYSNIPQSVFPR